MNRKTANLFIITVTLCGLVSFSTCSEDSASTNSMKDEIKTAGVVIEPQKASLEVNEELDFSAFVVSESGDTINDELNIEWNWRSSDQNVFTVEDNGNAVGHNPGEAFCIVEANTTSGKIAAKLVPIGLDSAVVRIF